MGTLAAALACLFAGLALGLFLGGRQAALLRRERAALSGKLRAHVLPVLEQRASGAVTPSMRPPADADPIEATVALGRAILEVESRHALPFTDTLEISRDDVRALQPPK